MISPAIEHPALIIHMTADPAGARRIREVVGVGKVDFFYD